MYLALFGIAFRTCCLLVERYPTSYPIEELYADLKSSTKIGMLGDEEWLCRAILGVEDGQPHSKALLACWKMQDDGTLRYDPSAPRYSNYDDVRFKENFEKWLDSQKKEKLRLNQGG